MFSVLKKPVFFSMVFALSTTSAGFLIDSQIINARAAEIGENDLGITPLMNAAAEGNKEAISVFVNTGSNINQKNAGGATALHLAVRNNHLDTVNELIKNGAKVNIKDSGGWTPLMRAARNGEPEITQLLIVNDANLWDINNWKESALMHASMADCSECVNSIMQKARVEGIKGKENLVKQQIVEAISISKQKNNKVIQDSLVESQNDIKQGTFTFVEAAAVADAMIDTGIGNENNINYKFMGETADKKSLATEVEEMDFEPVTPAAKSKPQSKSMEQKANEMELEEEVDEIEIIEESEEVVKEPVYKLKEGVPAAIIPAPAAIILEDKAKEEATPVVEIIEKEEEVVEVQKPTYTFKKGEDGKLIPELEGSGATVVIPAVSSDDKEVIYKFKKADEQISSKDYEGLEMEILEESAQKDDVNAQYKLKTGKEKEPVNLDNYSKKQIITPREEGNIIKDSSSFIY